MTYSAVTDYKRTYSAGVFIYDPPNDNKLYSYDDTMLGAWITAANGLINEYLGAAADYTSNTASLKAIEKELVYMEWLSRMYRQNRWFNSTLDKDQKAKEIPDDAPDCMELTEKIQEKLDYIKNNASQRSIWFEEGTA